MSNQGGPCFPMEAPLAPFFEADPSLWDALMPEWDTLPPSWIAPETKRRVFLSSRLIRLAILAYTAIGRTTPLAVSRFESFEARNVEAVRDFFTATRSRVPSVLFSGPYTYDLCESPDDPALCGTYFAPYAEGLGVPMFYLDGRGYSAEDRLLHPRAEVMEDYADRLSRWLVDERIVPACP